MKKFRGFTLIELLIVVAIIAILAAIAVPNFLEAQTRSKVSRVRSDHRSLATAIETYYIDNNTYPASTRTIDETADRDVLQGVASGDYSSTFRIRVGTEQMSTLTTPVAYITSNFPDPFADTRGLGFRYWTEGRGWILGSFGPDVDQIAGGDLGWADTTLDDGPNVPANFRSADLETVYDTRVSQPSVLLLTGSGSSGLTGNVTDAYTYDPTNGTVSPGDVWRVKQ